MQGDGTSLGSGASAVVALLSLAAAGCGPGAAEREAALAAADVRGGQVIEDRVDSVAALLADQPGLTSGERSRLRQSLNPAQVATARALGVGPVSDADEVRRLAGEGRLVPLEDTTRFWIVRDLTHSMPYVTPDARAMLLEVGQRFHARLDSLGLPPFRFEITSVLRTDEMQASLRRANSNASRSTSSHEFGTTVDIAYNTFAHPADSARVYEDLVATAQAAADTVDLSRDDMEELRDRLRSRARTALGDIAEDRAAALKALLGDVLTTMQQDDRVQPLIERAQPVYHMTVARRYQDIHRPTAAE